ncbi:hypothetical protein MINTM008_28990 [Mycobacterium intracellulare]|nr:hypothetical protein L843_2830 [Mycobacterium intracellulare MIN_061107_1834]BCO46916.1 hypothetical protein MINTM002_25900 [Mycobacterium intracellulare]BCO57478.1 hypothetical protein MINTM005_27220 [Mycobacterium intracellulare]BCO62737.1 hypothetical protein MINTM006_26870 [Mycobacterium intracellulare]BCO68031.1 hypothetical protein MINTM007_26420 [Mycobacterium intracellulare]
MTQETHKGLARAAQIVSGAWSVGLQGRRRIDSGAGASAGTDKSRGQVGRSRAQKVGRRRLCLDLWHHRE